MPSVRLRKDRAQEYAEVPKRLYSLAQEFKETSAKVVNRVLDQNLPMIKERITTLARLDDECSNFTDELDKLDDERYQDRKKGLIKVKAKDYEWMKKDLKSG